MRVKKRLLIALVSVITAFSGAADAQSLNDFKTRSEIKAHSRLEGGVEGSAYKKGKSTSAVPSPSVELHRNKTKDRVQGILNGTVNNKKKR